MRHIKSFVSHSFSAILEGALIATLIIGLFAVPVLAAKGGNGGGVPHRTVSTCTVDGNVVTASGLPTDEVINFMVTDSSGTWGWVLGFAGDEPWGVTVPDRSGPTTYEFAGRTSGPNGSKYTVFSACSTSG